MDLSILLLGILVAALFIVPFIWVVRSGNHAKAGFRNAVRQQLLSHGLTAAKTGYFGRVALCVDVRKPALLWCENTGGQLAGSRLVMLDHVVDCQVLLNQQTWSGKVNHSVSVDLVSLRLMFARGESMQESLLLFNSKHDDPMAVQQALEFARYWKDLVNGMVRK